MMMKMEYQHREIKFDYQGHRIEVEQVDGAWYGFVYKDEKQVHTTPHQVREATASREAMAWVAEKNEPSEEEYAEQMKRENAKIEEIADAIEAITQAESPDNMTREEWFNCAKIVAETLNGVGEQMMGLTVQTLVKGGAK
jgi:hypothetical protein